MQQELDKRRDPYEGLSRLELKAAFWELCHKLPSQVSDKDIEEAQSYFARQVARLSTDQPVEEESLNELALHHRARSELRRAYCDRLSLLLSHAPITPTYASFIANRRYGSFYHWGVDPNEFQNPDTFPAYLVGLEDDNDNLGIFDPIKSKDIERSDYNEEAKEHLYEHGQIVSAFGQEVIDGLQRRIREGAHPEHPRAKRLRNWRRDFFQRYQEEP